MPSCDNTENSSAANHSARRSRAAAAVLLLLGLALGAVGGMALTASLAVAEELPAIEYWPSATAVNPGESTATDNSLSSSRPDEDDAATPGAEADAETLATLDRLQFIHSIIEQRIAERSALGERIEAANEQDRADLRTDADALTAEIDELRRTLESIATGGVDTSLFETEDEPAPEGNWRDDVALIAEPIIASLKDITETPRRIKELNDEIDLRETERTVAENALAELEPELSAVQDPGLAKALRQLNARWQKRVEDATADIDIARFEIASLRGDKSFWMTAWDATKQFAGGRGLTLLMIFVAAALVFKGTRFLLTGYRRTMVDRSQPESRTRYRLVEYSLHALTGIMILVAIFIVIYQRGDVLLLGLMILLFFGLTLGIRHVFPRYVSEARLLLNIGPTREGERLIYRDMPWLVESINMFSILRNPELHGIIRLPLADLHGLSSRPVSHDEPWFPSSRGDFVLIDNDPRQLAEVIEQNPDTVTLRERGGHVRSLPSHEFYTSAMTNLSRTGSFGVERKFRIDYEQQPLAVADVPDKLMQAIKHALQHSDVAEWVNDVDVELESASESSLDYWCFVTMDSRAAKSFRHIERLIHRACVSACTLEGWRIPFPHLSIVSRDELTHSPIHVPLDASHRDAA